jgi:ankyrin repeat protein
MHAAASYSHLDLLAYLVSVGGDVNLGDDDGDTPLFTCESVAAAQWLVAHGADAGVRNEEGLTVSIGVHCGHG